MRSPIETLTDVGASDPEELVVRELTSLLLLDNRWRERRVETIVPVGLFHYQSRISLQFTIDVELVRKAMKAADLRIRGRRRFLRH